MQPDTQRQFGTFRTRSDSQVLWLSSPTLLKVQPAWRLHWALLRRSCQLLWLTLSRLSHVFREESKLRRCLCLVRHSSAASFIFSVTFCSLRPAKAFTLCKICQKGNSSIVTNNIVHTACTREHGFWSTQLTTAALAFNHTCRPRVQGNILLQFINADWSSSSRA